MDAWVVGATVYFAVNFALLAVLAHDKNVRHHFTNSVNPAPRFGIVFFGVPLCLIVLIDILFEGWVALWKPKS